MNNLLKDILWAMWTIAFPPKKLVPQLSDIVPSKTTAPGLDDLIIQGCPFTWRDALTQGSTGIIANPGIAERENIKKLALLLIPIIELCGTCTVNSWYRTQIHNAQVGGAHNSSHLRGCAVDLRPFDNSVARCKEIIKGTANRYLFYEINTSNWIHLDYEHNHDFIA